MRRNEQLPADCLFLASLSADNNTPDSCYVQTAQLDGETNLKMKMALPATAALFDSDSACAAFRGYVICEPPNANFDKFVGNLHLGGHHAAAAAAAVVAAAAAASAATPEHSRAREESTGIEMTATPKTSTAASTIAAAAVIASRPLPLPLEADQLLLRGCVLRNVDFAYALIIYTGRETKVRVRQTTKSRKVAQVEQTLNKLIATLVVTLVIICAIGALLATTWSSSHVPNSWYLRGAFTGNVTPDNSGAILGIQSVRQFFTFFLLNASIIPVSLYVSVRLARTLQTLVMEWDRDMFHEEPALFKASGGLEGEYPFKVRSMDLNDEIGQISHIFSDKTGTLTLNYMELRKVLVSGVAYGLGTTQIGVDRRRREGHDVTGLLAQLAEEELRLKANGGKLLIPHVNFEDGSESHPGRLLRDDGADPLDHGQGAAIFQFLLHLSLNHNVLRETVRNNGGEVVGSRLSASSPDEEAFLFASESFGLSFVSRAHDLALLRYTGLLGDGGLSICPLPLTRSAQPLRRELRAASDAAVRKAIPAVGGGEGGILLPVRVLNVLAYSQERKRMSVVVQLPVFDADGTPVLSPREGALQGNIVLFCKGADSVVMARLAELVPSDAAEADMRQRSKRQMAEWGNDGLRTLCFASKVVPPAEYALWAARFAAAGTDLEQVRRRKDKLPNRIDELMEHLENGLSLQGATANEDKLQPEVPETIAQLAKAGIKIWMVTGDKQETATNIGFATRLLDDTMRQVVATAESAGSAHAAMRRLRIAAKRMRAERLHDLHQKSASAGSLEVAVAWVMRQVEALEASMGVSPESGAHTDIDIDATEARMEADFDEAGKARPVMKRLTTRATKSFRLPPRSSDPSTVTYKEPRIDAPHFSPRRHAGEGVGSLRARAHTSESLDSDDGENAIAVSDESVAQVAMGHVAAEGAAIALHTAPVPGKVPSGLSQRAAVVSLASAAVAPLLGAQRRPFALIIDEHALDTALANPRLRAYLLYVAVNCNAVIACRARPDQKASVVRLIRHGVPSSRTLAVGDGANDVDMIGTAHVGVGISGAEGVQAANSSDYAIGRFRFLQRLLLVHGRWNYMRMTKLVLYMFWKNIFFVLTQFCFQIVTGFTGQKWYIEFGTQTFNLIYTSLPIIILAVLDRDLDASIVLRYPKLYDFSRLNRGLNLRVFASTYADALLCSVLNAFVTIRAFTVPDSAYTAGKGATPYIFLAGTLAFTNVIVLLSLRVAAEMNRHFNFFQVILLLSALLWIPAVYIFDSLAAKYTLTFDDMYGGARLVFSSASFWLTLLFFSGLLGCKMMAWKAFKRFNWPELRHLLQEAIVYTGDTASIDDYCETADLARRTGKSLAEVIEARKITAAATGALAPVLGGRASAKPVAAVIAGAAPEPGPVVVVASFSDRRAAAASVPVAASDFVVPSLARGGVGSIGGSSAISPGTIDRMSTVILEGALRPQPISLEPDGTATYDPANDFDVEEDSDTVLVLQQLPALPPPRHESPLLRAHKRPSVRGLLDPLRPSSDDFSQGRRQGHPFEASTSETLSGDRATRMSRLRELSGSIGSRLQALNERTRSRLTLVERQGPRLPHDQHSQRTPRTSADADGPSSPTLARPKSRSWEAEDLVALTGGTSAQSDIYSWPHRERPGSGAHAMPQWRPPKPHTRSTPPR